MSIILLKNLIKNRSTAFYSKQVVTSFFGDKSPKFLIFNFCYLITALLEERFVSLFVQLGTFALETITFESLALKTNMPFLTLLTAVNFYKLPVLIRPINRATQGPHCFPHCTDDEGQVLSKSNNSVKCFLQPIRVIKFVLNRLE